MTVCRTINPVVICHMTETWFENKSLKKMLFRHKHSWCKVSRHSSAEGMLSWKWYSCLEMTSGDFVEGQFSSVSWATATHVMLSSSFEETLGVQTEHTDGQHWSGLCYKIWVLEVSVRWLWATTGIHCNCFESRNTTAAVFQEEANFKNFSVLWTFQAFETTWH